MKGERERKKKARAETSGQSEQNPFKGAACHFSASSLILLQFQMTNCPFKRHESAGKTSQNSLFPFNQLSCLFKNQKFGPPSLPTAQTMCVIYGTV